MCCKCDSLNVSSFTYHSYEIENVSYYEPLNTTKSFLDLFTSQFSPLKTSSPKSAQNNSKSHRKEPNSTNKSRTESTSIPNLPPKRNLRILTVNCRSIKDKTSELNVIINYTKPDIVIGTESWLKGVKPGRNPITDAIKSSEVFPIQLIGTTEGPLVESSD
jgi:predicted nucleotide-binding protein (sugar kinase/HSP70/actin superfamily)